jgi:hypothetical protein
MGVERGKFLQRHGGTGHADQLLVGGFDLGGIAHGRNLAAGRVATA